jgi:hypothetical protein
MMAGFSQPFVSRETKKYLQGKRSSSSDSFPIHEASPRFSAIKGADGSIIGFKNIEQLSDHSVPENMAIFRQLKKNYPTKFILASIMGQNEAEWEDLAHTCPGQTHPQCCHDESGSRSCPARRCGRRASGHSLERTAPPHPRWKKMCWLPPMPPCLPDAFNILGKKRINRKP